MGELKISCPHCREHVAFPDGMLGEIIVCPHCGLSMALAIPGCEKPPALHSLPTREPNVSTVPVPLRKWKWMTTALPTPVPTSPSTPAAWSEKQPATVYGQIKFKTESSAGGCLVQGIGLLFLISGLFTFGIGAIIGVILLVAGNARTKSVYCSNCGNTVAKSSKFCPTCSCVFR
jgi:hypothetical protein